MRLTSGTEKQIYIQLVTSVHILNIRSNQLSSLKIRIHWKSNILDFHRLDNRWHGIFTIVAVMKFIQNHNLVHTVNM